MAGQYIRLEPENVEISDYFLINQAKFPPAMVRRWCESGKLPEYARMLCLAVFYGRLLVPGWEGVHFNDRGEITLLDTGEVFNLNNIRAGAYAMQQARDLQYTIDHQEKTIEALRVAVASKRCASAWHRGNKLSQVDFLASPLLIDTPSPKGSTS